MPTIVRPRFSRRHLLRSLGLGAAAAPFLPLLESAAGEPEAPPKRLLLFFHPHGVIRDTWLPQGTETDFTLPTMLEPLAPFQDRMVVLDGLQIVPSGPPGGPHTVGPAYLFTGSPMLAGDDFMHPSSGGPHGWGSSQSIEQAVADVIGTTTPFRSLELGVQVGGNHPGSRMSYLDAGFPLAPEPNPHAMFESIFGSIGVDTETAAKLKAERLSVIDTILPQLETLQGQVSSFDQIKIDAHLTGIRQIEQALSAEYVCQAPTLGEAVELPNSNYEEMGTISRQQIDLLVDSFACQVTNVASLMYRRGENDNFPYPHLGIADSHHQTSHAGDSDTEAHALLTDIYRFYAEELAYLAQRLDSIVEPDGSTMLDNTLIVWGSEVAKGNTHEWTNMPFVLLGGAGGAVPGGRFLSYPGRNHCQLLVSVANAMGLPITEFGGFDDGSGPLPGLVG
ncbi:MAG: DUF1552 domain-containing protein [Myxococcota bacterium]